MDVETSRIPLTNVPETAPLTETRALQWMSTSELVHWTLNSRLHLWTTSFLSKKGAQWKANWEVMLG